MTQRKWLAECHAWLDDPTSVEYEIDPDCWGNALVLSPLSHPHYNWRIKPKTITINGCELSKPNGGSFFLKLMTGCTVNFDSDGEIYCFATREDRDAWWAKLVEVLGA